MKHTKDHLSVFIFIVLAITNIWVLGFQSILNLLRSTFPVPIPHGYYEDLVYPKPYDIPVYIGLSALFVLLLPLVYKYVFPKILHFYQTAENGAMYLISGSVLLGLLLFILLGFYPMGNTPIITMQYVIYLAVISVVTLLELLLSRLLYKIPWIFFAITAVVIAALTVEPSFPVSWFDYTYMLGPAFEVLHGKTIYMQAPSQYGFLLVYALALVMKIFHSGIFNLPIVIWIMYTLSYLSLFYVVFKVTKSRVLSILFLVSLISINYFSLEHLPIAIPQIGPLRFLCLWFASFIFYITYFKPKIKYVGLAILSFLSLWVIDAGIQYVLAICSLECLLAITKVQPVKKSIINMVFVFTTLGIFFFIASFLPTLFGYLFLNPSTIFQAIHEYAVSGFGMIPLSEQTYFWLFLLIFFSSLFLFFSKETIEKEDVVMAFGAFLFFFASLYYVGRSHPHNIFHIAVLFLFTLFIFFSRMQKTYQLSFTGKKKVIFGGILFFFFVVVTTFFRQDGQIIVFSAYSHAESTNTFFPTTQSDLANYYKIDANFIAKENPDSQALIITPDDTALLMLSQKSSLINTNPMNMIVSDEDLAHAFSTMKTCPQKIFVAKCILSKTCPTDTTLLDSFIGEDKIYNKVQNLCNNSYKLSSCTTHICELTR